MNLTQAEEYLRNRHNALGSTFWSSSEICVMINSRCSIIASVLGLKPKEDVSIATVAGTQAYAIPSGFISIKAIFRDGVLLQELTEREWEEEKAEGVTPTGRSNAYHIWNGYIYLVPKPTAVYTLTLKGDQLQTWFDTTAGTIEIPEALHLAMLDGVLSDMYAKVPNPQMANFYEQKWNFHMKETFPVYKLRSRMSSRFNTLRDGDTSPGTGHGLT